MDKASFIIIFQGVFSDTQCTQKMFHIIPHSCPTDHEAVNCASFILHITMIIYVPGVRPIFSPVAFTD